MGGIVHAQTCPSVTSGHNRFTVDLYTLSAKLVYRKDDAGLPRREERSACVYHTQKIKCQDKNQLKLRCRTERIHFNFHCPANFPSYTPIFTAEFNTLLPPQHPLQEHLRNTSAFNELRSGSDSKITYILRSSI